MAKRSKLLRKALGFTHSYGRACHHHKHRVRKKNYRRAKKIMAWQIKVYGCIPIPPEWEKSFSNT